MQTIKKGFYQIEVLDATDAANMLANFGDYVLKYQEGIMFHQLTFKLLADAISMGLALKLKPTRMSIK